MSTALSATSLLAAAITLFSGAVAAADAPHGGGAAYPHGQYAALDARPDWGGVWTLDFAMPKPGVAPPPQPALKGSYLSDYQQWQKEVQATQGDVAHEGSYCRPPGMPIIMMAPQYPIEFLFTPGRVTIHHEAWMQWRSIYIDGRSHPADLDSTFNGDSTGHWEGDTLVVETIGIKKLTQMGMGMKHSDQLRVSERIHLDRADPNLLLDEMTLVDPQALEKPWTTTLKYKRTRDGQLLEFECAENDRNPVDAAGHTGFK